MVHELWCLGFTKLFPMVTEYFNFVTFVINHFGFPEFLFQSAQFIHYVCLFLLYIYLKASWEIQKVLVFKVCTWLVVLVRKFALILWESIVWVSDPCNRPSSFYLGACERVHSVTTLTSRGGRQTVESPRLIMRQRVDFLKMWTIVQSMG